MRLKFVIVSTYPYASNQIRNSAVYTSVQAPGLKYRQKIQAVYGL